MALADDKGGSAEPRTLQEAKTALRKAEHALETLVASRDELDKEWTGRLAELAHEIKTPLAAMMAYNKIMAAEHHGPLGADEYRESAQVMDRSIRKLADICDRILETYAGETIGAGGARFREVDVGEVINGVVGDFKALADERGIHLTAEIDPDFPLVWTEPVRLTEILNNVVSNAIKYTAEGQSIRVRATMNADKDAMILVIQDEGKGISPENLLHIMEPGYRTGDASGAKVEGSGLGLHVVDRLVRELGGRIEIRSRVGVGTVVSLILPTRRPEDAAAA